MRYAEYEIRAALEELVTAQGSKCLLDFPSDKTITIAIAAINASLEKKTDTPVANTIHEILRWHSSLLTRQEREALVQAAKREEILCS